MISLLNRNLPFSTKTRPSIFSFVIEFPTIPFTSLFRLLPVLTVLPWWVQRDIQQSCAGESSALFPRIWPCFFSTVQRLFLIYFSVRYRATGTLDATSFVPFLFVQSRPLRSSKQNRNRKLWWSRQKRLFFPVWGRRSVWNTWLALWRLSSDFAQVQTKFSWNTSPSWWKTRHKSTKSGCCQEFWRWGNSWVYDIPFWLRFYEKHALSLAFDRQSLAPWGISDKTWKRRRFHSRLNFFIFFEHLFSSQLLLLDPANLFLNNCRWPSNET